MRRFYRNFGLLTAHKWSLGWLTPGLLLLLVLLGGLVFSRFPLSSLAASASNNLAVFTATYLGSSDPTDQANAVDVAPDGKVIVGGLFPGYSPPGVTPVNLNGGGAGAIIRFNKTGRTVLSVSRVVTTVNDLEVNPNGQMVACGPFGVMLLNSDASSVVWSAAPGTVNRCAIGNDGTVAALTSSQIYAYNSAGTPLGSWDPEAGGTSATRNDVAVDSASQTIVSTGFKSYTNQRVATMKGWSYAGSLKWKDYDFSLSSVNASGQLADTTGERVAIGRDGLLYFAGYSAGGNSILGRDPQNINQSLDSTHLISFDKYNTPYNTASNNITWYGRFNPSDGTLVKGQWLLSRLDSGKGNTIQPDAIMADEKGQVYLAGKSAYQIENRSSQQINGITVGTYSGDIFLLVVKPDFTQRLIWTVFTSPNNSGTYNASAYGVSVRAGIAAFAGVQRQGLSITSQALQASPAGVQDGYLMVWPQFGESGRLATAPQLSLAFNPTAITRSGSSTLTFTLHNSENTTLTGVGFDHTLVSQLQFATNPQTTNTCGGAVSFNGNAISLTGGTLAAAQNCAVSVQVVSTNLGSWTTSGATVQATESGPATSSASATLQIAGPLLATNPVPGGTLHLGAVAPNSTLTATLQINNAGLPITSLNIQSASLSGTNAAEFHLNTSVPLTLAGGNGQGFSLSCTPTALGTRTATLTLTTNDPNYALVYYSLVCVGGYPVRLNSDNGQGDTPDTLSYVLKNQATHSGDGVYFELTSGNVITFSAALAVPIPAGITIDGGCDPQNGPQVTIQAQIQPALPPGTSGLTLGGKDYLRGLRIRGFPGQQLVAGPTGGNVLKCVAVSKT